MKLHLASHPLASSYSSRVTVSSVFCDVLAQVCGAPLTKKKTIGYEFDSSKGEASVDSWLVAGIRVGL